MLINYYTADGLESESCAKKVWRINNENVKYALIDFDTAMVLPKSTRRLPWSFATIGQPMWHPPDVYAGEHDYDPYAFDVGCMGNVFASELDVRVRDHYSIWPDVFNAGVSSTNSNARAAFRQNGFGGHQVKIYSATST